MDQRAILVTLPEKSEARFYPDVIHFALNPDNGIRNWAFIKHDPSHHVAAVFFSILKRNVKGSMN